MQMSTSIFVCPPCLPFSQPVSCVYADHAPSAVISCFTVADFQRDFCEFSIIFFLRILCSLLPYSHLNPINTSRLPILFPFYNLFTPIFSNCTYQFTFPLTCCFHSDQANASVFSSLQALIHRSVNSPASHMQYSSQFINFHSFSAFLQMPFHSA